MKITMLNCEQRSDEWRAARAGRLTGSRAADMLAKIKTGEAAARRDLRVQLVCEQLTGEPQEDGFVSKDMQWGMDHEAEALGEYEAETGNLVVQSGFIRCDEIMVGCSLDGHVGSLEGVLELKCPKAATHLKYLKSDGVPYEYRGQCQHNMWVTGAKWCDFVSFDPRFPPHLRFYRARLIRVDKDIEAYAAEALKFLAEIDAEVSSLQPKKAAA